jgi:hypothetical protein
MSDCRGSFHLGNQTLETEMTVQGAVIIRFWQRTIFLDFAPRRSLLNLGRAISREHLVDLAVRFELLALCAALAFVCAILLGAF